MAMPWPTPNLQLLQYVNNVIGFRQLKNMFPNVEPNTIKQALASTNGCIELATESLLDSDGNCT